MKVAQIVFSPTGDTGKSLAAQRISNIHDNHAQCVMVYVYGNKADEDTLVELNDDK